MTTILATLAAGLDNPYAVLMLGFLIGLALYCLAAFLTAKPAPESPYVVEQLDDEHAVLWVRGAER